MGKGRAYVRHTLNPGVSIGIHTHEGEMETMVIVGIYHKDHQYGKRLMEYLNHQKDFPMTASFTSDEEMFFKQEQEGDFECLVLAEETDYHGDFPVCRIGANESMGGMYCQSAKEIAAGIYHCLNVSPQIENERIFGVYSPISRLEISAFARNMAASNGWIYFGMQPYGHFEEDEADDLLLFYIKEHKEDIVLYFMEHQKKFDGCVGFAGASCYLDYRELSMQDYEEIIMQGYFSSPHWRTTLRPSRSR